MTKRKPPAARRARPSRHQQPRAKTADIGAEDEALLLALQQGPGDPSAAVEARLLWHAKMGRLPQAQRLAEALLQAHPEAASVLNNLSLLASLHGHHEEALALAERVLVQDPDNLHANANAIRALTLSGRIADARARAEHLLALSDTQPDAYVKKSEALSMLGEDDRILALFAKAQAEGRAESDGYLCHLAACAALGRGRPTEATRLWHRALQLLPDLEVAAENLADLQNPQPERQAPWPFPLVQWIPEAWVQEMAAIGRSTAGKPLKGAKLDEAVRAFVSRHPPLLPLLPLLLERGDPLARQTAIYLCQLADLPPLRAALHAFVLGQRGSDEQRMRVAAELAARGGLPSAPLEMWINGIQRQVMPLRYEIHSEITRTHSPKVTALMSQAGMLLRNRDGKAAEALLSKCRELEPEAPDIVHNFANSLHMQGRTAEAEALLAENHRRHPDYFFGRTYMAMEHARAGRLEEAEALVASLRLQRRLHQSEFASLVGADVEIALARKDVDKALQAIEQLEDMLPENVMINQLRQRIASAVRFGGGAGGGSSQRPRR